MDGRNFDDLTRKLATGASRRSVLRGLLGGAAALGGLKATGTLAAKQTKVDLCHATSSLSNPYVQITVANSAADLDPHFKHGDFYYVPGKTLCCGPKDCPGTDQCNIQACVYSSDAADRSSYCGAVTPRPDDTPCDDGKFCTVNDVCTGGVCGGAPRDCSDGVPCTDDSCDEDNDRCVHTPNNGFCEDEYSCTTNICSPGEGADSDGCVTTPNHSACDDGYSCTADTCDPGNVDADQTTGCVNAPDDSACDDGRSCTTDTCDPGNDDAGTDGCVHAPNHSVCDDSDDCTADSCDPSSAEADEVTGCVNHFDCNLGDDCCDDGDACTTDTCDPDDGTCSYAPVSCDDEDICTTDSCDSDLGCINTFDCNNDPSCCDDSNACTTDTCNADGTCSYEDVDCGTSDACNNRGCDADEGCYSEPTNEGGPCPTGRCDDGECVCIPTVRPPTHGECTASAQCCSQCCQRENGFCQPIPPSGEADCM